MESVSGELEPHHKRGWGKEEEEGHITVTGGEIAGLSFAPLTVITAVPAVVKPSPRLSAAWRISEYLGTFCKQKTHVELCELMALAGERRPTPVLVNHGILWDFRYAGRLPYKQATKKETILCLDPH